jgi:hypothetical protein
MRLRLFALVSLSSITLACGGSVETPPASADSDVADTAAPDTFVDTGTVMTTDDGVIDSTSTDSTVTDSESFETGAVDTGFADVPLVETPDPFDAPPPTASSKLDLLFVVDNSYSMADKQSELARAIPGLVKALTTATATTKAVTDLHIGVITSSLGSHGTSACDPAVTSAHSDDRGHLLPRTGEGGGSGFVLDSTGKPVAATCPTPVTASALTWTFDPSTAKYTGASGATTMQTAVSCVVESAAENGCGYEETLESMYHFLIDPAPYDSAKVACTFGASGDACGSNKIVVSGTDATILSERASFLRSDSTVAIVVLTDEDDASLKPAGLNWLPWGYGKGAFQRGWSACPSVPDDFEPESAAEYALLHSTYACKSCFEDASDPNCKVPWAKDPLNSDVDGRNLRAFHQTQRFGYNFLWGRQRYVAALTQKNVVDSMGVVGTNPLFAGTRTAGNVLFAAIVGVPKNLVTGSDGLPKSLTAADWELIASPVLSKRDPHMIQSIAPRAGIEKFAGDRTIDPVNGGDRDIVDGDDLQYACIAPRASTTAATFDCSGPSAATSNPLCGPSGAQPYFKAYPGLRHLRVARDVGTNAMVASICDTSLDGAVKGIVQRLQAMIKP